MINIILGTIFLLVCYYILCVCQETNFGIFWGILSIVNFIVGFSFIILSRLRGK